jgi:hypothetical protein
MTRHASTGALAPRQPSDTRTSEHNLGQTAAPHPVVRTLVQQPLTVCLFHGLAGSGAPAAIAFGEIPGAGARLQDMTVFGLESTAGMALASGAAGVMLRGMFRSSRARRAWLWSRAACRSPSVRWGRSRHGRGNEWRRRTFATSRPIRLASTRACTAPHQVSPTRRPWIAHARVWLSRAGRVRNA